MTQTKDNIIDRDELQETYIRELIEDVEEYYPELLISEPDESTGWN